MYLCLCIFFVLWEKCRPQVLKIIHSVTDNGVKKAMEIVELVRPLVKQPLTLVLLLQICSDHLLDHLSNDVLYFDLYLA